MPRLKALSASVAIAVVAVACSGETADTTVRFFDSNAPVANAVVVPMLPGPEGVPAIPDPNATAVETNSDGGFSLSDEPAPGDLQLQVTIAVPSEVGEAVGRLDFVGTYDATAGDFFITEPVACSDLVDCGTPLLPDLTPLIGWDDLAPEVVARLEPSSQGPPDAGLLPAETWFVSEEQGRVLLRFATVAANVGDGPLDVIAAPDGGENAPTWQRIWTDTWHFEDVAAGEFVSHEGHDHIHFDAFERYRLLDASGAVVASSEKVSFCLRDSVLIETDFPQVTGPMLVDDGNCEGQQQVINAGFGDHYHALLEDQWIDVTGVPAGDYIVEVTVDPLDLIREADEDNNVGTFAVTIG